MKKKVLKLPYVGAAGTALVHSFSLYIVFHSVIFNSDKKYLREIEAVFKNTSAYK